ncbi:type III secretion system cytoplasmic ring protein SctQ [Thiofilum flexile]|uniref:type III secretion system cytoplasmic ring protein SctQ n=1 Tax=Thiofilum flexile TaxID=125627 RepID=UPI0003620558|nr:type III secretion system cytoplasmic ring protein SctQ [Thiofilum flexile]
MNNLLLNKSRVFSFSLNETKSFRLRLIPGNLHQRDLSPISLTVGLGDSVAGLWLTNWPLVDNIRSFIPEGMLDRLPENLAIALLENALEPLLMMAEHGLGTKLKIEGLSADKNNQLYTLPLGFELTEINVIDGQADNSLQVIGTLLVEERTYPLLQERLRYWPSDLNPEWDQLQIPLRIELSRQQLTLLELNNLELTDVILLNDSDFLQQQVRFVLYSNTYCSALFNSNNKSLTINSDWNTMSDQEQKHTIDQLNQVPIQLTFDIGQHTLSFNEIKQLRPGYVIELSTPLSEIVQIRSQNKLLGTGELVDVNGRLGVRLLTLFGNKKTG